MTQYRFSKSRSEIAKTLAAKLGKGSFLTVWQKQEDGQRSFLEKMPFHELFPEEGVFTLKLNRYQTHLINPAKEIYFLLDEQDFIFKTKMAIEQKEYTTFQIPKEVRLKEMRIFDRQVYTLDDRKLVEVVFTHKTTEKDVTLTCPLISLSEGGACIVVSKETISSIDFSAGVFIKFNSVFQAASIRNARVYVKKNLHHDELYALGVQFQIYPEFPALKSPF